MIELFVHGLPAPQGSKRAIVINKRAVLIDGSSDVGKKALKEWRDAVKAAAEEHLYQNHPMDSLDEPLEIAFTFFLPLPEGDPFRTRHAVRPDWDKLSRSTCDALTDSKLIVDDARIYKATVKCYYARIGDSTGAIIRIWPRGAEELAEREELKQEAKNPSKPASVEAT